MIALMRLSTARRRALFAAPWAYVLPMLAVSGLGGCSEHLPAYSDPNDLLAGTLYVQYVTAEHNQVLVTVMVVNKYDETLQDTASLSGTCEITLKRQPNLHKTITLSSKDLQWGDYDSTTHLLTMDRGDHLTMALGWDFVCDDSTDLRTSVFRYVEDPSCPLRHIAQVEELDVRLSLKIFAQTPTIELGPTTLSFCHLDTIVPLQLCAPLNGDNSCTALP